jgi:hypothetical protein
MLNPALLHIVLSEPANKYGIPEFGGDTEILAATHQSVGLGTLDSGGDALGAEEVVYTLRLRDDAIAR